MTEYTAGILFLARDWDAVVAQLNHLDEPYQLDTVNDKWAAFFVEDEWLSSADANASVRRISHAGPLLHFASAEDQGWRMQIFHRGAELTSLNVSYELAMDMAMEEAEARNLDIESMNDDGGEGWAPLLQQVEQSEAFKAAFSAQFANVNIAPFRLFGIDDTTLQHLTRLLTPEYAMESDQPWQQVEEFRGLLSIAELTGLTFWSFDDEEDEAFDTED